MSSISEGLALAARYQHAGDLALMERVCRQTLHAHPDAAELHNCLGAALALQGRLVEALASFRAALQLTPDLPDAHNNVGNVLRQMGQLGEAEASYRNALRLRPDLPQPHNNLGLALATQGRVEEAVRSYQEALRLWPDYPEALINLGDALQRAGRATDAEAPYRHALRLRPDLAAVHNNLGVVLAAQDRPAEAEACYRQALRLDPNFPRAHYNLGTALTAQGQWDAAQACYEQALRMGPDDADALNNLGNCYQEQGRLDEALACYRKALHAKPDDQVAHCNLLFALHYHAGYDPEAAFAEHVRWAEEFEGRGAEKKETVPLTQGNSPLFFRPSPLTLRDPNRRLRVGYVSGDFREHVLGRYSEAFITAHDRSQVEVFCYANVRQEDERTRRIKSLADHWRSLIGLSDEQAAGLIRADRIDLLIDLAGLTRGNRLGVFVKKPAPIQVSNFGYQASTGLTAIDYRLTDAYCDPPGWTEHLHTEKLVRLPDLQWCYAPGPCPDVAPLPAQRAGEVTFGSFNNLPKVTEPMIGLWAQILTALPGARMIVLTGAGRAADERVLMAFRRHGVGAERVTLVGKRPRQDYLRLYLDVAICLDTYPYCGCTTTADALWMGVPVVTLAGKTWLTRQGVGILTQAGLGDLVTESPSAYVETAVRLARDIPRLQELRGQLRDRVQRTLGNVQRFTRQLEAAYREMWQTYCRTNTPSGLPPAGPFNMG